MAGRSGSGTAADEQNDDDDDDDDDDGGVVEVDTAPEVGAVLAVRPQVVLGAAEVLRAVQKSGSGGVRCEVHVVNDNAVACFVETSAELLT